MRTSTGIRSFGSYAVALHLYGGPQVSPRSKPDRIHGCVKRDRGTVERFDYYTQVPAFARRHWRNFTFKSGGDQWRRQDLVLGVHDDRGAEGAEWGGVDMGRGVRSPADPCTKFEVSSFSRCRDISGVVKFLDVSHDPEHAPFSEIYHRQGGTCYGQCTKFEVSRFTRYEAMNGGAKCRKRGGLGS